MADEPPLIPVFIPRLAAMLASAEQKKGSPLELAEVIAIRDKSACIMMQIADAEKMVGPRGYQDVNPKNVWVDWHRLRPQMTGGYLPRIILCVPGSDELQAAVEPLMKSAGVDCEFRPRDPNLGHAFKVGAMTWQSLTDQDHLLVDSHTKVLYALSKNFKPADAAETARSMIGLGRQLLDAGGFAIKCESSGIAHSSAIWSMLDERAKLGDAHWGALFRAFVLYPIGSKDMYTCGMHLLGAPDLIVAETLLRRIAAKDSNTASTASRLFAAFGIYLLDECQPGSFVSGHTFSEAQGAPRFRMIWEPCTGYEESDYFFNPFGRWRFTEP